MDQLRDDIKTIQGFAKANRWTKQKCKSIVGQIRVMDPEERKNYIAKVLKN